MGYILLNVIYIAFWWSRDDVKAAIYKKYRKTKKKKINGRALIARKLGPSGPPSSPNKALLMLNGDYLRLQ